MTVIVILACLAIAGAELYMARSAREMANRLKKLEAIARVHDQRIQAMTGGTAPAGTTAPITTSPSSTSPRSTAPDRTDTTGSGAADTAAQLARLAAETTRLRDRLEGLEEARDTERRLYARVDGTVESLERMVGEVLRHTIGQLEEAVARSLGGLPADLDPDSGTVRGVLCGAASVSPDPLIRAYERCARDTGLRIRFQAPRAAAPWHARYYLAGKDPRELERDFLALLGGARSPSGTPAQAAFDGLLSTLGDLPSGFAQIGPMVAVRVPEALLCGVLTLAETRDFDAEAFVAEPAALAGRLRGLPAERVRDQTTDQTMPAPPNGSGPGPDLSAAPRP
ncbi:hypothetical protein [Actinomadura alba]|uniref:Uncharacterized protein n=1 Tax=Actinomadura alba TaxID=406431 RepID=A0ABR7LXX0_9ACTN|nr:hypothetical protein [Actinomadura alba]MBC6469605.1 hypothetical protein [Actinomadura alba]